MVTKWEVNIIRKRTVVSSAVVAKMVEPGFFASISWQRERDLSSRIPKFLHIHLRQRMKIRCGLDVDGATFDASWLIRVVWTDLGGCGKYTTRDQVVSSSTDLQITKSGTSLENTCSAAFS